MSHMLFGRRLRVSFQIVVVFVVGVLVASSWTSETQHRAVRTWNLQQFGYSTEEADYSLAGFLTENLLLVAINQRPVYNPHPLFEDTPDATLVVFDISNKTIMRTARMPMLKSLYSMAPVLEGYFMVLTLSEVKLCSVDLRCDRSFSTRGPLNVTRDRTRAVVGGNLMTQKIVLDTRMLTPVTESGDGTRKASETCGGHSHRDGSFDRCVSSMNDERFMVSEVKQTAWNKLMNPLAGFGDRPYNSRRITVYERGTGAARFTIQWDPRKTGGSLLTMPALSPTGHRVAFIRRGVLEVFDVP